MPETTYRHCASTRSAHALELRQLAHRELRHPRDRVEPTAQRRIIRIHARHPARTMLTDQMLLHEVPPGADNRRRRLTD